MKNFILLSALFVSWLGLAQPTTNAPVPTHGATEVYSVYSDSYTNSVSNYNPGWGQSGAVNTAYDPTGTASNYVMAYTNFNYQGTDLAPVTVGPPPVFPDLSTMEYLHVDVWTTTATVLKVSPINNGTGTGEFLVEVPLVQGGWSSVNLPKSAFTGMTWNSVFQMKFDGQAGANPSTIYLDNIYFWKNPVDPASDATLSDLKVDGTTVTGFSSAILSYNYSLPSGTTTIPQITLATATNTNATVTITQATALPGSATVLVTSQNGSVTKTYIVNFAVAGPNIPAPTPPARNAWDVISIFSDAYSNIAIDTWSAPWDDSSVEDMVISGDNFKKIDFTNFLGVDFSTAGHHDMSQMTHYHIDYWTDEANIDGKVLNSKFSQWGGTSGEVSSFINTGIVSANGQWVSIDVPITSFTDAPQTRTDIAQFLLISNLDIAYVDNIYVYRAPTMSAESFANGNEISVYPNPVTNGSILNISKNVTKVAVFSLTGQKVIEASNTNQLQINNLTSGVYFVNMTTEEGISINRKVIIK